MKPHLFETPFRQHWNPLMARAYPGLLPDVMDDLTHHELRLLNADLERITSDGA